MGEQFSFDKNGSGCNVYVTVNCCGDKKPCGAPKPEEPCKTEAKPVEKHEDKCEEKKCEEKKCKDEEFIWPHFVAHVYSKVVLEKEDCKEDKKHDKCKEEKKWDPCDWDCKRK